MEYIVRIDIATAMGGSAGDAGSSGGKDGKDVNKTN